jgi:hypothetical protein
MRYNITARIEDEGGKKWEKAWSVNTDDYEKEKVVGMFIGDEIKFDVIGRLNDRELFEQGVARQQRSGSVDEAIDLASEEVDTGAQGDGFDEYMRDMFAPKTL